ncbi:hypothetical protein EV356DRAFT_87993 [Viridothelium virens]|uniref:NACHT domain-containing protein n=1 Tax=Viridothelium virens TaxID=1048519 RepID=A0A6A6GRQ3_VIRVR|nr:hypothetical protein EV356DRAFT_87993 [Viridothelium virens]
MTEGLEQVSRLIAHYAMFEAVYCKQPVRVKELLLRALVRLYAAILVYLSHAGRFYEKSAVRRIAKSAVTSPQWAVGELLKKVKVEESSVTQLAKLADAEIVSQTREQLREIRVRQIQLETYHAREQVRLRSTCDSLERLMAGITTRVEELREQKIEHEPLCSIPRLPTSQYRQHHAKLLEDVPSIPANWLIHKQDGTRSASSIIWLQSNHGSDTSKAMALVAEALIQKAQKSPEAASVAFFYCQPERTRSDMIAQALIEQLCFLDSERRGPSEILCMCETKATPHLDLKKCIGLVLNLTERRPVKIIIDKVDDCGPVCRDELLGALRIIISKSYFPVKVLISSSDPAGNALDFEDVSTINLRHGLELAAIKSPFIDPSLHELAFQIVDDQLIQEMELYGERVKRLMPVPDEAFWCHLLQLEVLISTYHSQKSIKDELQDPLGCIFRRVLGRVAPDAFNFHAREIGTVALIGAYSAKSPVPRKALIEQIGLVWPIRDGLSAEDILENCHGFLILGDDDHFDLAHELLVEQVRLDRKELLYTEVVPQKQGVVYEIDGQDELKRAMEGATMLLREVG